MTTEEAILALRNIESKCKNAWELTALENGIQALQQSDPIKAKWIDIGNNAGLKCSNCGYKIRYKNGTFPDTHSFYRYCPHCGAKTDIASPQNLQNR